MALLGPQWQNMAPRNPVWSILRREPLYHKLQYAKVPRYDSGAAMLGTVLGAFTGYLALATLGSGGSDLTDLTTLCVWVGACLAACGWYRALHGAAPTLLWAPAMVWLRPLWALCTGAWQGAPQPTGGRGN